MDSEKKSFDFNKIFGIVLWISVGAFLTYILLKKEQPATMATQSQPSQDILLNWKSLESIPSIEQLNLSIPVPTTIQNVPVPTITQDMPIPTTIQQPVSSPISYKNKQITKFVLDKDGDMIGIETTRDATIDGK